MFTINGSKEDNSNTSNDVKVKPSEVEIPKTGDGMLLVACAWGLVALIAAGVAAFAWRRRNR